MKKYIAMLIITLLFMPINANSQSGCCSHHNGVSDYCTDDGYAICNDDEISSCLCEIPQFSDGSAINNDVTEENEQRQVNYDIYKLKKENAKLKEQVKKLKQEVKENKYFEILLGFIFFPLTIGIGSLIFEKIFPNKE